MENIFVYGTLADKDIQLQLFGRIIPPLLDACLPNWEKKTYSEFPYLIQMQGASTEGKIIQLSPAELTIADEWEEVPLSYQRILVNVITVENEKLDCWVYVASGNS